MMKLFNSIFALAILLAAVTLWPACNSGDDDDDSTGGGSAASVLVTDVYSNPNMNLSCYLEFNTSKAGTAIVEFGTADAFDKTFAIGPVEAGENKAAVVGMRAASAYKLRVVIEDDNGNRGVSNAVPFETPPLPEDFPELAVTSFAEAPEDSGYYFFTAFRPSPMAGYVLIADSEGHIVFYHRVENGIVFDLEFDEQRNLYFSVESFFGLHYIGVISLAGEPLAEYDAGDIGGHSYHHEIEITPDGNIMTIGLDNRDVDFPRDIRPDESDPRSVKVVGDRIMEINPDGEIVWDWNMWDHFSPLEDPYGGPTYNSLDANFWWQYGIPDSFDWTHTNALVPDWENGTMIVSIRHFNSLINIDMDSGDVLWEMGPDFSDFTLESGEWFYRQHAPEITPDGNLMMYDNGYSTAVTAGIAVSWPFERPYSRAVEYAVDWEAKTLSQVWEYREDPPFYSDAMGDIDLLASGNLLITSSQEGDIYGNEHWARLMVVTHDDDPQLLWQMKIPGYSAYRAEWFPTISPYGATSSEPAADEAATDEEAPDAAE